VSQLLFKEKDLNNSILKNALGVVVPTCNPSYLGGSSKSITVQGWPGQKTEILPEKQI
jgi:hypothetical protein